MIERLCALKHQVANGQILTCVAMNTSYNHQLSKVIKHLHIHCISEN